MFCVHSWEIFFSLDVDDEFMIFRSITSLPRAVYRCSVPEAAGLCWRVLSSPPLNEVEASVLPSLVTS